MGHNLIISYEKVIPLRLKKQKECDVVAHERLTEPRAKIK